MKERIRKIAKGALIACLVVLAVPTLELVRESFIYYRYSSHLEAGNALLKVGMDQSDLQALLGPPDSAHGNPDGLVWEWAARKHQGFLFAKLGLADSKGHYGIIVKFDEANKLSKIFEGVN
jgi:hypothetical protein